MPNLVSFPLVFSGMHIGCACLVFVEFLEQVELFIHNFGDFFRCLTARLSFLGSSNKPYTFPFYFQIRFPRSRCNCVKRVCFLESKSLSLSFFFLCLYRLKNSFLFLIPITFLSPLDSLLMCFSVGRACFHPTDVFFGDVF
ncbi:hypothetical protein BJ742DRAFT_820956 [Cladochytrium replicatum]|nr:hypothetical protein BJ742DRAFT_820956 [Cladochytrium replicatum]